MSTAAVDYAKLAEQARSTGPAVDYAKLADQARGSTENTRKYLAENDGKTILGPKVEHSALSLVSEFLQGLPMAARREHERITGQPISKTLKESVSKALEAAMPITQIPGMLMAQLDEAKKAYRDAKDGDYMQAGGHALAAAVPGLGPAAASAGEQIAAGDTAGGVARGAGQVALALAPAIKRGAQAAPSGVRGAITEAKTPTELPAVRIPGMGRIQIEAEVPAIVADAAKGAATGGTVGAIAPGVTTAAGATAGAAIGAGKTLVRGYRKGTAAFREAQRQAAMPPRAPLTASPANIPATTPPPQAAPPSAPPGVLPSGRRPGGIQNQTVTPTVTDVTPSVTTAVDPLAAIEVGSEVLATDTPQMVAKRLNFGPKPTAAQELQIRVAKQAAAQKAAQSTPTPAPVTAEPTPFAEKMQKALDNLRETPADKRKIDPNMYGSTRPKYELSPWEDQAKGAQRSAPHELKATIAADLAESSGITPEQVASFTDSQKAAFTEGLKRAHPNKWKTGLDLTNTWEDIADTLKTRQANPIYSRFNRPVENPQLLPVETLTGQIDRLAKKPNRTPGETNLLNQLRDEVKKRGTK